MRKTKILANIWCSKVQKRFTSAFKCPRDSECGRIPASFKQGGHCDGMTGNPIACPATMRSGNLGFLISFHAEHSQSKWNSPSSPSSQKGHMAVEQNFRSCALTAVQRPPVSRLISNVFSISLELLNDCRMDDLCALPPKPSKLLALRVSTSNSSLLRRDSLTSC